MNEELLKQILWELQSINKQLGALDFQDLTNPNGALQQTINYFIATMENAK